MPPDLPARVDVAVVGAGPAGLAAAAVLAADRSVLVLDREAEAGGIPRHCGHSPYGLREFRRVMGGRAYAGRLRAGAEAAGARIATGVTVTALRPGPRLVVTSDDGVREVAADLVLLATGAREGGRMARSIGGTRPGGVLTTGALQGLVHLQGLRPFQRPVVLGTELVSFSALLTCRQAGIRPVAMVEPGPRVTARWPAPLLPRAMGVPLLLRTDVVAVEGRERVEAVALRGPGGERRLEADGLLATGLFRPEAALLAGSHLRLDPATGGPEVDEFGRCSDHAFFAAGNLLRTVETAGWCWAEGRAVARAMLRADALPSGPGQRVAVEGDAIRWALPQRLVGGSEPALPALQIHAAREGRARLSIRAGGREVAARAGAWRPERRLLLPLPPRDGAGGLTLTAETPP